MKKFFPALVVLFLALAVGPVLAVEPMFKFTPSRGTYTKGSSFEIIMGADSGTVETQAIDVWFSFDPAKVEIESVNEVDNLFENLGFLSGPANININDGTVDVIIYPSLETHPSQVAVVNGDLLKIKLKPKIAGTINIDFICTSGLTSDSNILDIATVDKINCPSNINGVYTITDGGTSDPNPTAVPTAIPTSGTELPKTGTVETTIGLMIFGIVSVLSSLALKFL
ncbi:MAG TPA: LPXTG cell wall anchor domain-containing protein [Candidatus Woesebacteria bacterium]|nr:LPXTG cell wall anchor domain-containing protein [Candidatus Woesebacteria bacterium]HPR99573.1 LPXTG cell wall anchor domain-containing protein [Candidatus Woesebacteria bacterium]